MRVGRLVGSVVVGRCFQQCSLSAVLCVFICSSLWTDGCLLVQVRVAASVLWTLLVHTYTVNESPFMPLGINAIGRVMTHKHQHQYYLPTMLVCIVNTPSICN
jgi:hypothetical protein